MSEKTQADTPKPLKLIDETLQNIDWGKVKKESFELIEYIQTRLLNSVSPLLTTVDEIERAAMSMLSIYEPELSAMFVLQTDYCIQCGECCRRCSPICVTLDEVHKIASHLKISPKRFRNKIKGKTDEKGSLHIRGEPCPFLKGDDCSIYPVRPGVCRAFPVGYAISSIVAEESLEMPNYCHALKEMHISVATSRLLNDMLCRERPDLVSEMFTKTEEMIERSLSANEVKSITKEGSSSSERFAALIHLMTERHKNRQQ